MQTSEDRFAVPLGDERVLEGDAELWVSDELAAWCVGGPTRWAKGKLHLTRRVLVFRDGVGAGDHRQDLTLSLADVASVQVAGRSWRDVLRKRAQLSIATELSGKPFELGLRVDDPAAWARALREGRAPVHVPPGQLLDEALGAGLRDRARYASMLASLRLPVLWGTSHEELVADLRETMRDLGLSLPEAFFASVAIPPELIAGCEDYEMEEWGAATSKVAALANQHLGDDAPRRFHAFASDVPGWDPEAPVLLLVTDAQRARLLELGVLRPVER